MISDPIEFEKTINYLFNKAFDPKTSMHFICVKSPNPRFHVGILLDMPVSLKSFGYPRLISSRRIKLGEMSYNERLIRLISLTLNYRV